MLTACCWHFLFMPFYVYILQSTVNDSFYKGSTNNLLRRLAEHNQGREASTKRFCTWKLVWYATKPTRSEALRLEKKLKNLDINRTIAFMVKYPISPNVGGPDVALWRQSGC
jgi:putative endonuclease